MPTIERKSSIAVTIIISCPGHKKIGSSFGWIPLTILHICKDSLDVAKKEELICV
jgi:hypothetical protein